MISDNPYTQYIKKKRLHISIFWIAIILIFIIYKLININISTIYSSTCIFIRIAGRYCPFCGGTRMVDRILHFNFITAFRYNPLMFLIGLALLVFMVWYTFNIFGRKPKLIDFPEKPIKFIVFIMLVFIIYSWWRNSGHYPNWFIV